MPLLEDNLAVHFPNFVLPSAQRELPLFRESRLNLVFDEDIYSGTDFIALNTEEGYGLLRVLEADERPNPRDVVIYEALPNELPRIAGIVSTVPQTPLSHVNLRAIQNGVPNAFIRDALDNTDIVSLLGRLVHYRVTGDGYTIRAAARAEVDAHYDSLRPAQAQTPPRDLSVTEIAPLSEIGFDDWTSFGVKAANVAVPGTLGFPEGTVPDGFAVPFYFYDKFMEEHGLYDRIKTMPADPGFQTDFAVQEDELKKLRKAIKDAETPDWMTAALTTMHATFPEGTSLRYRSSTNNEDLPGFSGAGLYDSKTQDPEETEEDGIAKSLKAVFASLWNFRAFIERDFYRIDHLAAAMGVLVHPNYSDELANGVAVSFDPAGGEGNYYVSTQIGEDLVTNPDALSVPEELLLNSGRYAVLAPSNQVEPGQLLMSNPQLFQLREHLEVIHDRFEALYGIGDGERFAIEIEFKITSDDILAIKQARPWIFDPISVRTSPTTYSPDDVVSRTFVTRAQMAVLLSRLCSDHGRTSPGFHRLTVYRRTSVFVRSPVRSTHIRTLDHIRNLTHDIFAKQQRNPRSNNRVHVLAAAPHRRSPYPPRPPLRLVTVPADTISRLVVEVGRPGRCLADLGVDSRLGRCTTPDVTVGLDVHGHVHSATRLRPRTR